MQSADTLGVRPNATAAEIEAAYDHQMSRWQALLSHPTRRAEAKEMIARLDAARNELLSRFDGGEGELRVDDGVLGVSALPSQTIDKDACPECDYRENPARARFCINCRTSLTKTCPNPQCRTELPWHQDVCDQCGANVETFLAEQDERRREEEYKQRVKARAHHKARIQELRNDLSTLESKIIQPVGELKEKYGEGIGCFAGLFLIVGYVPLGALIAEGIDGLLSLVGIPRAAISSEGLAVLLFFLLPLLLAGFVELFLYRLIVKYKIIHRIKTDLSEESRALRD